MFLWLFRKWSGPDQDSAEVILADRPCELEKRVHKNANHQEDLDSRKEFGLRPRKWQFGDNVHNAIRGAKHRDESPQDQYRGRGEEGRASQQAIERRNVGDAVLVLNHAFEPLAPIKPHRRDEACLCCRLALGEIGIPGPAGNEPDEHEKIDQLNLDHRKTVCVNVT